MSEFVNKVAESGIITINLEHYLPTTACVDFDIAPFLFMGLILKEKDYREALKQHDWSIYQNNIVAVHCSADAIIPQWAYMLATTYLQPIAADVQFGTKQIVQNNYLKNAIAQIDAAPFANQRIVVKGCGDVQLSDDAYIAITYKLLPVAKSIMYGEPCSTVPIYKKRTE
jgi:hypothetical protein